MKTVLKNFFYCQASCIVDMFEKTSDFFLSKLQPCYIIRNNKVFFAELLLDLLHQNPCRNDRGMLKIEIEVFIFIYVWYVSVLKLYL